MLARREHSVHELASKLQRRGFERGAIDSELERLAAAGLQSDARFAELFAEQRVGRGDGPAKIRAALRERGVDAALAESALAPFDTQWHEQAQQILERRFGADPASDRAEQARRARFLQRRGFPGSVITQILERGTDDE